MSSPTNRGPLLRPARAGTAEAAGNPAVVHPMDLFRCVGFFNEKPVVTAHLRDFFESAKRHDIQASIMFGTLLGHLRHGDIIPWDDDVDIAVFNYDAFLATTAVELEALGYVVEPDIRDGRRMGCRIFHRSSARIPNRGSLRFPWLGIWEHQMVDDDQFILPPEQMRYRLDDFLPLRWEDFVGTSVGVPNDAAAILNAYFDADDWMKYGILPDRDHRNGGVFTNFSRDKYLVSEILAHLAKPAA